jgi:V/A-type H+-transporting ATPase subunit E
MTQDLQQLLEKIQRDGVDRAKSEADKILAQANSQAHAIVEAAKSESAKIIAKARQEAEGFEHRAEETIRQSARDTLLTVEKSVTALLSKLLADQVNSAMGGSELVSKLAEEAVRTYLAGRGAVEVAASAKLADALRSAFAEKALTGVTVVTDDATGTGFRVRLDNGRVEHTFTGVAVADALARQLRPRLAALLKQA